LQRKQRTHSNERVTVRRARARDLDAVDTVAVAGAGGVGPSDDSKLGNEGGVDTTLLHWNCRDGDDEHGGKESGRELHRGKTSLKLTRVVGGADVQKLDTRGVIIREGKRREVNSTKFNHPFYTF
jgi:hypothetical protein